MPDVSLLKVILVITMIGSGTAGAEALTLEQCIEIGLKRNLALRRTALERELDAPASRAAWGQFLPSVSVGFSIDQSAYLNRTYINPDGTVVTLPFALDGRIIPVQKGERRGSRYFVRAEELLFDGGRNYLNLKNTDLQQRLRRLAFENERLAVRSNVRSAYSNVVARRQQLALAVEVISQRRRQLELARLRFETGSVTRRDVLQAEVDLGRARSDSLQAVVDLRCARRDMNLLLGLPVDTTFEIAGLPPLFEPAWDADSLVNAALEQRLDLLSSRLSSSIMINDVHAAKGDFLPRLTAVLSHDRTEQSGSNVAFTLSPRNRFTSVGLTASWRMFDRFTRSLKVQEAKVKFRQSMIQTAESARLVRSRVLSALDRLKAIRRQAVVAVDNSRLARETLDFEQERYRLGSGTVIELGAAQVSYIQARSEQIRLETEFHIALGELEQAVGKALETGP